PPMWVKYRLSLAKLCCTRYQSNHFPVQRLKSYRVQEDTGNCNIRAIIFLTVKGRVFCANPKQQWVIEAVETLQSKGKAEYNKQE
uniref:Chemokine interleukin-8-like domain-containing protein n=1 Tax=Oryzias sinensis TaxID=183150 RepID=A0A8C7WQF1_9TELE